MSNGRTGRPSRKPALKTLKRNFSKLRMVKVNSKTTILVDVGTPIEKAKAFAETISLHMKEVMEKPATQIKSRVEKSRTYYERNKKSINSKPNRANGGYLYI